MAWLHRTNKTYIEGFSPRSMEENYGLSFTDVEGAAIGNAEWIYKPDLSAVEGVPSRYWIIMGDVVSEMSQAEKDIVDQAILDQNRDSNIQGEIDNLESVLRQVVVMMVNEINILRSIESLPNRTITQVKTQLRNGLGS